MNGRQTRARSPAKDLAHFPKIMQNHFICCLGRSDDLIPTLLK